MMITIFILLGGNEGGMFYPGQAGGEGLPFYPGPPNGPGGFIPYPANGGQGGEGGAFFPGGQGMFHDILIGI